jgi:hypothetical protein
MDQLLIIARYGDKHSFAPQLDFTKWLREQEMLVSSFGSHLTHILASFIKKPLGLKENDVYCLPRAKKKFENEIERSNVLSLGFNTMISEPKGSMIFDWDYTSWLGSSPDCNLMSIIGVDIKLLKGQKKRFIQELIEQTLINDCTQFDVNCGFSAIMGRDFGPAAYATGLAAGDAPDFLLYDANAWMRFAGKQCNYRLRNVFGYNVLNCKHLDIRVGNKRLEEWIKGDPYRGQIKKLNDKLSVWTFAQDMDMNDTKYLKWNYPPVVKVRKELEKYRIFPWHEIAEE